jgi:NADPH:quinone reductase-like Zn-dependent oxidoreductase
MKGLETMKAYQLSKAGAGIEGLISAERATPKPAHRQILVKVRACSLNFRDLSIVRGAYRLPAKENLIPLSDGAGDVVAIGPNVQRFKVGDRVAGTFFQRWTAGEQPEDAQSYSLGGGIDGMLAEYAVLEEDGAVVLPPHLSPEEGATLPCAALTAWSAMVEHARLKAGDTVLLQGTGGVSIFGLLFAKAMGIRAIIISSSDQKLARANSLGAAFGINYKTTPDWDKAALEFTDGRGVDHVVEVGGAATLTKSLASIRMGGKVSLIGGLSGGATELNPSLIFARRANVQGISIGSMQVFESMNRAIETNLLKPPVDKVFLYAQSREAYQYLGSGEHFGKIVIKIAD